MLDLRLYLAQRLSALVMVPLTLGHIAVMIYAIQGGLSTAEILGRTHGSLAWFAFYGTLSLPCLFTLPLACGFLRMRYWG